MNGLVSFITKPRNFFWAVFIIKIAAVFVFVLLFGADRLFWSDSSLYRGLGEGIFRGEGFASTRFMPLYPFLLGLFLWAGGEVVGAIALSLVQAALAAGTALILFLLASRFTSSRLALGAALLFSLEPFLATIHILLIPETVFVFFLALFVFAFIRYLDQNSTSSLLLAVVAIVATLYIKPAPVYLVVLIGFLLLFVYRRPRHAFIFVIVTVLLMSPWMLRNNAVGGSYDLTSDDSGNICSWGLAGVLSSEYRLDASNWAEAWALPQYRELEARCTSVGSAARIFLLEYPRAFATTIGVSTISLLTNEGYSALLEKDADEQVKRHHNYLTPVVFINKDWPTKIKGALGEFRWWEILLIGLGRMFWIAVSALAVVGAWRGIRGVNHHQVIFLIIMVGYFITVTVVSTGFGVGARLRYPIVIPLILLGLLAFKYERSRV
ncbi:MAG: glycosyltransferase family 39 protein [Patescibacteria group bacterium]